MSYGDEPIKGRLARLGQGCEYVNLKRILSGTHTSVRDNGLLSSLQR